MTALFIGGNADGIRMDDPRQEFWTIITPVYPFRSFYASYVGEGCEEESRIRTVTDTYRRERLRVDFNKNDWVIYVLDSLTISQAIGKLIAGYPLKPNTATPNPR